MRPHIQRVVFPRPLQPQPEFAVSIFNDVIWPAIQSRRLPRIAGRRPSRLVVPNVDWIGANLAAPTFDATTVVAAIAQQRGWQSEARAGDFLFRPQDAWIGQAALPSIVTGPTLAQQRDWRTEGFRRPPLPARQEAEWIAETLRILFAAALVGQQRDWRTGGLRRPPLSVPAVGWWIADTFTPDIFWAAVASQQRAWATGPKRGVFHDWPQQAWWAETLPVAFDVTITVASAMAQMQARPPARRIERLGPFVRSQDAWITANIPAVTTEAYRQMIPPGWRRSGERPV